MEEIKKTHIATTCKVVKMKTPTTDELVICVPIEVAEGTINQRKNFVDVDGEKFLPAYDAYRQGKTLGYILETSYEEVLKRGKKVLSERLGYDYPEGKVSDNEIVIQNYKEEYTAQLEEMVWYYDLGEVTPTLCCDSNADFYEMYGVSINRDRGIVVPKPPKNREDSYAAFRSFNAAKDDDEGENKPDLEPDLPAAEPAKPKINLTRLGLIEHTKKYVISQDEVIKEVVSAIYNPIRLNEPRKIQNILLYGPTGSGKSYMVRTIAKALGLPFYGKSVADFSSTGYVGGSVSSLYAGLYRAAGCDIKKLEKGAILFVDEFAKLLLGGNDSGPDVKGQVYEEFLELFEHGNTVTFNTDERGFGKDITYNKERLIIVAADAFSRLNKKKAMGFGASTEPPKRRVFYTTKDFERLGLTKEMLGRLEVRIPVNALFEDDLYRILMTAAESPYLVTQEAFAKNGASFELTEEVLRLVARKALELDGGARALKGTFEQIVEDVQDDLVDSIDRGESGQGTYTVTEEQAVKRLGTCFKI